MFQRLHGAVTTPLISDRLQIPLRTGIRLAASWNTDERGKLSCRWKDFSSSCTPSMSVAVLTSTEPHSGRRPPSCT
jgi:hypothetical protein